MKSEIYQCWLTQYPEAVGQMQGQSAQGLGLKYRMRPGLWVRSGQVTLMWTVADEPWPGEEAAFARRPALHG